MKTISGIESVKDEQLVEWSLTGDREAFGQIVERYQSLVCSITYGATGNLTLSEDIAQETFLTAWRQLASLNDVTKLRAWLCGIARNLVNNSVRRGQREPVQAAEPLDAIHDTASTEPSPSAQAVSREEEAILWRALERIPDTYREPLILFYREHQSVERVAQELELSEDAVKQRLSRGRTMLAEQVAAFVESTLQRTTPGQAFTVGVLAALPALTISAKAAAIGATAAKGSATAKAAAATGLFSAILGTLLIFFGNYVGYRIGMDEAHTDKERGFIKSFYRKIGVSVFGLFIVFAAVMYGVCKNQNDLWLFSGLLINGLIVIYLLTTFAFVLASVKKRRAYYSELRAKGDLSKPVWEFRSRASLFGLPLIHIRIGDRFDILNEPVTAWIAVGNYAVGGLFAFGGVAIAPASIGFCAVGFLPLGGLAIGLLALGGFALGIWTYGGLAVGWQAFGCFAVAWNAAAGELSLAHGFALGRIAQAAQANNEIARQVIGTNWFFRSMRALLRQGLWLNLLWVLPLVIQWQVIASARRRRERSAL